MKKRVLNIAIALTSFALLLTSCEQESKGDYSTTSNSDTYPTTQSDSYNQDTTPSEIFHIVSFETHGGSQVPPQKVLHGSKATKPNDPTKQGYDFVNWTYNGEQWSFIEYSVTEDMTLDATWSVINYEIEYNLDGGTNSPSNPLVYTIEDEISLYDPSKEGYTFTGWVLNGEKVSKIEKGATGNLSLTATWGIHPFNVTVFSSDLSKGTVLGSGTYEYNSLVKRDVYLQVGFLIIVSLI